MRPTVQFYIDLVSVVDPNTLNLDLDPFPGFWLNLDPDRSILLSFERKNSKIIFEKNLKKFLPYSVESLNGNLHIS